MEVTLFDSFPRRRYESALRTEFAGAKRVDAAVAFVTSGGTMVLHEFLSRNPPHAARLLASLRFPTDLSELVRLADKMPGRVFIHTGFKTPLEPSADRGQFHSKAVLVEYEGDARCVLVGSHNWTENAFRGHNLEAGIIIRCTEHDSIVTQVRRHIDACIGEPGTEPFDPGRLRFYQAIQRELQPTVPGLPSELFPGFVEDDAVVIHAELPAVNLPLDPMRLFIPLDHRIPRTFFVDDRRVILFVYPRDSLFATTLPQLPLRVYRGSVTMNNVVSDAPVAERLADMEIRDLHEPRLCLLAGRTVPPPSNEERQVVMKLESCSLEFPLFHSAGTAPRLKWAVEYREARMPDERVVDEKLHKKSKAKSGIVGSSDDPPFVIPTHLAMRSVIRVPSLRFYPNDLRKKLTGAVWAWNLLDQSDVPELEFVAPEANRVLNDYVYLVTHRFPLDRLHEIQTQPRLF